MRQNLLFQEKVSKGLPADAEPGSCELLTFTEVIGTT